jgi:hypothetical protein
MELYDPGVGLEIIATGLMTQVMEHLDAEQDVINDRFSELDKMTAGLRGQEYVPVFLETVPQDNYYLGNNPSLIDDGDGRVPLERYPNVCFMAYQAGGAPDDDGDHFSAYSNVAYIETMVKASPQEGPEVCSKRIWRQVDSINNIIMRDRTLGGSVYEFGDSPSCIVSEVFERPKRPDEGHGEDWFWQSARLEYTVTKYGRFE